MKKPIQDEMAILMFLGIIRTMRSRIPKTDKTRKMIPLIRMTPIIEPKDNSPLCTIEPSKKLVPIPHDSANGMFAYNPIKSVIANETRLTMTMTASFEINTPAQSINSGAAPIIAEG